MHDMRGQDTAWAYTGDFYSDPSASQGQHGLYGYPGPSMPHPGSSGDGRVRDSEPQEAGGTPQMGPTPFDTGTPGEGPGKDARQRQQGQTPVTGRVSEISAIAGHDVMGRFLSRAVGGCFSVNLTVGVKFRDTKVPCLLDP